MPIVSSSSPGRFFPSSSYDDDEPKRKKETQAETDAREKKTREYIDKTDKWRADNQITGWGPSDDQPSYPETRKHFNARKAMISHMGVKEGSASKPAAPVDPTRTRDTTTHRPGYSDIAHRPALDEMKARKVQREHRADTDSRAMVFGRDKMGPKKTSY